jgi:hypothetical protein
MIYYRLLLQVVGTYWYMFTVVYLIVTMVSSFHLYFREVVRGKDRWL